MKSSDVGMGGHIAVCSHETTCIPVIIMNQTIDNPMAASQTRSTSLSQKS
jgi:hypothetical protein